MLATLIEAYEDKHYPMDPPDPIEAIKYRMEQQGLTRKDLEPMIGTRTRVAEVLNGKRNLSISMIRNLHAKLGISAEVLIQPPRKRAAGPQKGVCIERRPGSDPSRTADPCAQTWRRGV